MGGAALDSVTMTTRLSHAEAESIDELAKGAGVSRARWLAEAIRWALEHEHVPHGSIEQPARELHEAPTPPRSTPFSRIPTGARDPMRGRFAT